MGVHMRVKYLFAFDTTVHHPTKGVLPTQETQGVLFACSPGSGPQDEGQATSPTKSSSHLARLALARVLETKSRDKRELLLEKLIAILDNYTISDCCWLLLMILGRC